MIIWLTAMVDFCQTTCLHRFRTGRPFPFRSTKVSASSCKVSTIISRIFTADLKRLGIRQGIRQGFRHHRVNQQDPSDFIPFTWNPHKPSTILHYIPPHIDYTNTGVINALLRHLDVLGWKKHVPIYPEIAKSKWLSVHLADFSNRLCTRDLLARQGILETRGGTPLVAAPGSTVSWRH